jgi:hypothetical protein
MRCLMRAAFAAALVFGSACGTSTFQVNDGPTLEGPFVAIPKALTGSESAALSQALDRGFPSGTVNPNDAFYIAINRSELGQKWFMSAYLTQLFPRFYPGAVTLGTRVVSFKVQNGKLFVFDVDERKKTSDSANPELIVEAYPIVENQRAFSSMPGSGNYILFDPAAGLNRFNFVADAFSNPAASSRFEVELMFSQRFRRIADGVTFDQVFTGSNEAADPAADTSVERNAFRYSGSIGVALRRYKEGAGYKPVALPDQEHFFRSDAKIVPYESRLEQTAAHWNIQRGMRPIVWKISPEVQRIARDPRYAQYDVVGSISRGVENWNKVFGFKALEARLAAPGDSAGDDDTNFIHVDIDNAFGFAFADWRNNPNTGEIRGASVYFSSLWFEIADGLFEDDPAPNATPIMRKALPNVPARPKVARITWDALGGHELCALHPEDVVAAMAESQGTARAAAAQRLTKKEKVERYITHVMVHEIGHTLGLRHNFKGSLVPPSSSVMEYIEDTDAIFLDNPASYDIAAIKYLYGLSNQLPTDPFCTDEETVVDPLCATFDITPDPLGQGYGPQYATVVSQFLSGQAPNAPNRTLNNMLKFVRAGADSMTRTRAFGLVMNGFAVPLSAMNAGNATYARNADRLTNLVLSRMYLDPAPLRGEFVTDPSKADPALNTLIMAQLRGTMLNTDKVRSYPTRRTTVDVLKKLQTLEAYALLTDAKAALTTEIPTLTGNDALLAKDLLGRIDAAITPYFTR